MWRRRNRWVELRGGVLNEEVGLAFEWRRRAVKM